MQAGYDQYGNPSNLLIQYKNYRPEYGLININLYSSAPSVLSDRDKQVFVRNYRFSVGAVNIFDNVLKVCRNNGLKLNRALLSQGMQMNEAQIKMINYMYKIYTGGIVIDNDQQLMKHQKLMNNGASIDIGDLPVSQVTDVPRLVLIAGINQEPFTIWNSENYKGDDAYYTVADISGSTVTIMTDKTPKIKYGGSTEVKGVLEIKGKAVVRRYVEKNSDLIHEVILKTTDLKGNITSMDSSYTDYEKKCRDKYKEIHDNFFREAHRHPGYRYKEDDLIKYAYRYGLDIRDVHNIQDLKDPRCHQYANKTIVSINKNFCRLCNRYIIVASFREPDFHFGKYTIINEDGKRYYVFATILRGQKNGVTGLKGGSQRIYKYGVNKNKIKSDLERTAYWLYNYYQTNPSSRLHGIKVNYDGANTDFRLIDREEPEDDSSYVDV